MAREEETLFGLDSGEDRTAQGISDMLGKFMSPEIANFLSTIIKGSMGDVFNNTISGGGIVGPGALFGGPRDLGVDLMDTFNRRSIELAMTGTERALQQSIHEQRVTAHQMFGAGAQAEQLATGFGFTNLAVSMMAQLQQPKQLQAGMQIGAGFLGVRTTEGMSADAFAIQQNINANVGALSTGVFADINNPANMNKYYGLGGQDLGRIYAELARTGAITANTTIPQTTDMMSQSAAAVSAGSRFFQGGALDILDQTNALLGVNAINTFGGEDTANMFRQMTATGRATGLLSQQMIGLASMSAQFSMGMGAYDTSGAMSNAAEAGVVLRGALGAGGRFVNERRLREGIVRKVTGAGESDMAKMVSGIYSSLGADAGERFIDEIRESGVTTLSGVGNIGRRFGAGGSDLDFLDMGETFDAREARAGGIGVQVANAAEAADASEYRRDVLRSIGRGDIANQIRGPITMEKLQTALGNDRATLGRITKIFERESRDIYGMGASEVDAWMIGSERAGALRPLREHIAERVEKDQGMARLGKTSGLQGLYGMFSLTAQEGGKVTTRNAFDAFFGKVDLNGLTRAQMSERGREFLDKIDDVELLAGVDVMSTALRTGMLGKEQLTEEQRQEFSAILLGNMDMADAAGVMRTAAESAEAKTKKNIAMQQASANIKMDEGKEKGFQNEIEEYAMINQFLKVSERKNFRKVGGANLKDVNIQDAQEVGRMIQNYLQTAGEEGQDILESNKGAGIIEGLTEERYTNFKKATGAAAKQDEMMKMFEPATDVLSSIFTLLQEMFTTLKGDDTAGGQPVAVAQKAQGG